MERILNAEIRDYAGALRAIGQDVADLLPLYLEVELKDGEFDVRGRGLAEQFPGMYSSIENFLRKAWNMLIRHDPEADIVQWQLCAVPFARSYTQEDIGRCNGKGFTKRSRASDIPNIYSLGERLRVIGKLVDSRKGELVRLTKNLDSVSFQYRDEDGQIHSEEFSARDLYRIQREYYANRKTAKSVDPGAGREPKKTVAA